MDGVGIVFEFYTAQPLFKCTTFLAHFQLEKMRSVHSAQCKVELRRLGNQLPVLGKANSICKIVNYCVFCLFVMLRLTPGRVGPRDKDLLRYHNWQTRVASRRCTKVPVAPLAVGKKTNSRFLRFFGRSVPLFHSLMLTQAMEIHYYKKQLNTTHFTKHNISV